MCWGPLDILRLLWKNKILNKIKNGESVVVILRGTNKYGNRKCEERDGDFGDEAERWVDRREQVWLLFWRWVGMFESSSSKALQIRLVAWRPFAASTFATHANIGLKTTRSMDCDSPPVRRSSSCPSQNAQASGWRTCNSSVQSQQGPFAE
jgi:hypothetical protein